MEENKKLNNVGYVYDREMLKHEGGLHEIPERILFIYRELEKRKYLEKMTKIFSREIIKEELLLAHTNKFINRMEFLFDKEEEEIKLSLKTFDSLFGNKNSLKSAKVAAGSTINLVENILNKKIDHGIAIIRPPGHHAGSEYSSGFCFFNNIALAAKYCVKNGVRAAIVDWDIHAGDGTYNICYDDKNIFLISIHKYDYGNFYPGVGEIETDNVKFIALNEQGTDSLYKKIFEEKIIPELKQFDSDIILISAGFDAAMGEHPQLGGFLLTPDGYYEITKMLLSLGKPIMLVLEGGYNLNVISECMAECTRALLNL